MDGNRNYYKIVETGLSLQLHYGDNRKKVRKGNCVQKALFSSNVSKRADLKAKWLRDMKKEGAKETA